MTEHKLVLPRAEEVLPALREGAALLPGCRDRQSRPLIFIPSKEQSVNGDSFRNVLLYLYEATAHDARENGTVIVIDMRGKQPSSNLKIFLKAVDDLCGQANVHSVLVIKPEKFWDNKKAQLSTGSTKFEIQWIAYEQLVRFVDVTQIPKELGGAYPYNHSEWLQARIELERWIWKVISILKGLEEQRKLCESDQSFGDVSSVKRLIDGHNVVRERILNLCPVDVILAEHNNVSLLIQNPQNGVHNPDLMASLPHMKTLQDRIATIKEEVFHVWKERYEKLESVYQYKLYEQDAEEKLRWMQKHTDTLTQTMSNIGSNETEAGKFQREFDDIEKAVRNSDVTIEQLTTRSGRLKSTGTPHRSKVDRTDQRVREEWERLKLMLIKRRTIVTCSVAFFRCLGNYNSRYRTWLEHPGIDATRIDSKNTAQLDQAIQNHQEFWNQVEGVYAEAVQKASELKQHLRAVNATDGHQAVGQRVQDLGRAQKQLHEVWRKNKVKLHSMLALTAFHSDTQRVLEWLNEHGDPYLTRNIRIGDTEDQAKQLQRNHEQFRRIAENTYGHMEKLFEASNMIAESGVTDSEEMRTLLEALEARMGQFRSKCDLRKAILDHSLLFHIHFNEITVWYTNIEAKYGQRVVSSDLNDSEAAKEEWVVENDATAEAFATTMGDGTTLLNNLQAYQQNFGVDYSQVTSKVLDMIKRVEDSNARFVNRWSVQRQILDMSCNYASFIRDVREVLNQISSWEQDMRGMIDSPTFLDNAYKVKPFHEDNYIKVKDAVGQIKNISKELLQAIHGNQLTDLKTREGHLVVTVIQDNTKVLDRAEKQVTQLAQETSDRIEHALRYNQLCKSANEVIRSYKELESQMYEMGAIPDKLQDSHLAAEKHAKFKATLEKAGPSKTFFDRANDLLMSNKIPREYITELNEMVTNGWRRLCALTEERHKLLHTAVMYYKTTDSLGPILDQLERMCATPSQHICNRQFPEMDLEETANQVSCDISKHEEWKEKFVKSFLYAQKTSDSFIKYIQRWASDKNAREINQRIRDVQDRKAALRERQSRIFQMWTEKKKNLESCRIFVLFEASMKKNMDWLEGEGRAQLNRFQGHAKQQLQNGQKDSILEDFSLFKITVKERRATIQTLLTVSKDFLADSLEHRLDMEKGMAQIRDRFEQFSRTVADCEATLRGGRPPGSKDELSLDRNSDHSVGERIESAGTVVSKEMKKMRKPVEELIQTEREYVKDLQKCVEVYIQEFDSAAANLPLPLRGRRAEIFINIEEIFEFHSKIFLNELLKYENDPEAVGCSFTFHVDCLSRLYTKYCSVMDINTRKDIMILPETLAFFGQLREKHKIESLDSMLIKPVQRITRYTMMIRELLKMTETLVHADSSLQHNIEEIRDAYEVVLSLPKRANDIMHLNELDKDKLNVTGEFVMQDTLTVWDSKSYIKKSKERQVFLFELAIVVAKKMDMPSKSVRYLPKGKPILLNSITVVEHVENDVCRFGIRIGNESSNDNRIDFKAKDEKEKIAWVKRIRENRAGLSVNLEAGWENRSLGSNSNGTGAATHRSSKISSASSDRHSRDAESISSNEQRNSIHSCGSNEGAADQWFIRSDFNALADGQLTVKTGERVEATDQQPQDTEWTNVIVVDHPHRAGLVPSTLLLPDQPSSSTDRPDASSNNGGSVVKRKSLRRIFTNSTKEQKNSTAGISQQQPSSSSAPLARQEPSSVSATAAPTTPTRSLPVEVPVIVSSPAPESTTGDDELLDDLPPPMEELPALNSTTAHMNEDPAEQNSIREEEADAPKADEKSPEEVARFKRHYVLMELVETEKDYVRDLTSVVEGYIANLDAMELPAELQGKDKIIFANIAQILEFHKTCFLKEIEKCLENYDAAANAFVKYQRRLDVLYVKYCQNKPKSDYLVSQDDFEGFFAETKLKLGHKVALCDLLIKPVQRIMKYQLLLKDILKFTERAQDSTVLLKKALQVMHVVPKACDDMMQVGRLQNFDGNLGAQGRLIHQGTLSIAETMGSNTQKAKDRRIFLFEQSAIIADHIPPKKEFGNPTYIFKNQIMVNKMQFQKNANPDEPLKFIIGSTDPAQPNFLAIAQSQEEKDEWVLKLEDMLDQQKRMLEQLVNPKKFMGGGDDITGSLGGMNLGGSKAAPAKSPVAAKASPIKAESPKKEKSKLFGFGKKPSAKSPTSP